MRLKLSLGRGQMMWKLCGDSKYLRQTNGSNYLF